MDPINETVIFPDRPLFLTHRKRPGNPGTIDLSPANLNGFLAESSSKNQTTSSSFNVQSQPNAVEGTGSLARYRKIKFIDNNVAEITKRRSARPRQLKSKRLRTRSESSKSGSSSSPDKTDSKSTSPSSDAAVPVDEAVEKFVRQPTTTSEVVVAPIPVVLTTVPRCEPSLYTDGLSTTITRIMPQMIGYYLNIIAPTMYPFTSSLIYNPMRSHWFPLAMTDELMFHTMMYACAVHMTYLGKGYQRESAEILQCIVREINKRIMDAGDSAKYSDSTVCAVSCLAMTEVYCNEANRVLATTNRIPYHDQAASGSWDKWKLHAEGMRRMITLKGGMNTIAEPLRMKIHRSDIEGAIESGMSPVLDSPTPTYPPLKLPLRPGQPKEPFSFAAKRSIFSLCKLRPEVLSSLNDITELSLTLDQTIKEGKAAIHPGAMDELIINLQHRLLKAPFEAYSDLNNASRYSCLIYLKSLLRSSDLRWMSVRLAEQLQNATRYMIPIGYPIPLLCWICYMGLFGSMPGGERWKWFASTLIDWYSSRRGRRPDWDSMKQELMQIAWIPDIHDESARTQWQLVENIVILGIQARPFTYVSDTYCRFE